MASISANGSKGHHKFTLELTEGNYDINNNTSPVEFTFKISPLQTGWNWSGWSNKISYKVIIDGAEYTGTIGSYNGSSTVTLKSDTKTVYHEADGSKSIDFSFTVTDTSGQSYTCGNASSSGSMTLTTIPRASSVSSITGGTIGQTLTVNISRASSSFTHDVIITYGSKTQTLGSGVGTSASGTLDMDFCNQVPSSTTAQAILTLITYSGGNTIGRTDQLFTITVPNSVVPSISSVSKSDSANLVGTYGAYVQGKSDLRVVTNASGSYSSWISSYIVNIKDSNNNVLRQLSGNDVTLYDISYTGTLTIEVIVTDSRGRQASNNSTITVAGYNNPKINSFSSERRNNDSTVTLTWNAEITNINNADVNGKTFNIYKRQKGQSSWGTAIETYTSAYTYSRNDFTTTCDENYGWEFLFEATDSFTSTYYQVEVGTAFELINWGADGTSMAIGKVSEKSDTLEVALKSELVDTDIDGTLNVTGNTTTNGDLTTNGWHYANGRIILDTPQDIWSGQRINASNRNEASIEYYNEAQNKRWLAGYGCGGYDGFTIFNDTKNNCLTISDNGRTDVYGTFVAQQDAYVGRNLDVTGTITNNYIPKIRSEYGTLNGGQSIDFEVPNVAHTKLLHIHCTKANWFIDRLYTLMGENGWVYDLSVLKEQIYNQDANAGANIRGYGSNGVLHIVIENIGSVTFTYEVKMLVFDNL